VRCRCRQSALVSCVVFGAFQAFLRLSTREDEDDDDDDGDDGDDGFVPGMPFVRVLWVLFSCRDTVGEGAIYRETERECKGREEGL